MRPGVLLALAACLLPVLSVSALAAEVRVIIDTARDVWPISPYVYGSNAHGGDAEANVAAVRFGGNRTTGYNWETNYSSAGNDWRHSSDDYLVQDLPEERRREPAIVVRLFHEQAVALRAADLVTLQMAGYVAADNRRDVSEAETAPSARWKRVDFKKLAPFSLVPDTRDDAVYMDEQVNFLVNRYGQAAEGGVQIYSLDNEPAIWPNTHPRIHPQPVTCDELVQRSIALARAVKDVDPTARVSGPALYGWTAFESLQNAPDWDVYKEKYDDWFINFYLDRMRQAEERYGVRLLDLLDVHWYPEARVGGLRITTSRRAGDPAMMRERMHAPRTLWDEGYQESSWIGQWHHPVRLLPRLQENIRDYYPGTLLAITEHNYGGEGDVSGAVAHADFLGLCGKHRVYMANRWGPLRGYVLSAYRIFRNYDGRNSTFGETSVHAETSDPAETSAYASLDGGGRLHLVLINKRLDEPAAFDIECRHAAALGRAEFYVVDGLGAAVRRPEPPTDIAGNRLTYAAPPASVSHLVLSGAGQAAEPSLAPLPAGG